MRWVNGENIWSEAHHELSKPRRRGDGKSHLPHVPVLLNMAHRVILSNPARARSKGQRHLVHDVREPFEGFGRTSVIRGVPNSPASDDAVKPPRAPLLASHRPSDEVAMTVANFDTHRVDDLGMRSRVVTASMDDLNPPLVSTGPGEPL